jgi:hypothetical protein
MEYRTKIETFSLENPVEKKREGGYKSITAQIVHELPNQFLIKTAGAVVQSRGMMPQREFYTKGSGNSENHPWDPEKDRVYVLPLTLRTQSHLATFISECEHSVMTQALADRIVPSIHKDSFRSRLSEFNNVKTFHPSVDQFCIIKNLEIGTARPMFLYSDNPCPPGFAVKTVLISPSYFTYVNGNEKNKTPPISTVHFRITMIELERQKSTQQTYEDAIKQPQTDFEFRISSALKIAEALAYDTDDETSHGGAARLLGVTKPPNIKKAHQAAKKKRAENVAAAAEYFYDDEALEDSE